jgi:RHS repeat-associated protein
MNFLRKYWLFALLICDFATKAQLNINGRIDHVIPNLEDSLGCISLSTNGGTSPYIYKWLPGNQIERDLMETTIGSYSITVIDMNDDTLKRVYNLGYKSEWNNFNGTFYRNDSLVVGGAYTGYPTAKVRNVLRPNVQGWMEFVIPVYNQLYLIGFTDADNVALTGDHYDINFGLHITTGNALYVWSEGNFIFLRYVNEGDIIQVGRDELGYYISCNSIELFSVESNLNKSETIKALTLGQAIANLGCSFVDSTTYSPLKLVPKVEHLVPGGVDSIGSIYSKILGGSSPYEYTWQPNLSNTKDIKVAKLQEYQLKVKDFNGDSIIRSFGLAYKALWTNFNQTKSRNDSLFTDYEGGGIGYPTAHTKNVLSPYINGWTEVILGKYENEYLVGFLDSLSVGGPGYHYDIDFAFHLTNYEALYAWYSGQFYYLGNATEGDAIRIGRNDSVYYLLKNGQMLYNVPAPQNKSLRVKALLIGNQTIKMGCSFQAELNASFSVAHANYDDLYSGVADIKPEGGTPPYTAFWSDGNMGLTRSDLFPGTYTVVVTDSAQHEMTSKVINTGVRPVWNIQENIINVEDSIVKVDSSDYGILTSHNISYDTEVAWMEFQVLDKNIQYGFGFIGNENTNMDTTFIPSIIPSAYLETRVQRIKEVFHLSRVDSLAYTSGLLSSLTSTDNIYFIYADNGLLRVLVNNAPEQLYSYSNGDRLKIGRNSEGNIYLAINDEIVCTLLINVGTKYLVSSIILGSNVSRISQIGIYTNATLDSYPLRFRSPVCIGDACKNWVSSKVFDQYGNLASESRQFYDVFGRETQAQERVLSENNILAAEKLYDSFGRTSGQTLIAPVFSNEMCYKGGFFINSNNQHYGINDFDKPNTLNKFYGEKYRPAIVGNTNQGSLGWYYSNNNTNNAYVPADSFPYNRVEYYNDPLNRVYKYSDVGRFHKLGSGHEKVVYYLDGGNDLLNIFKRQNSTGVSHTYELKDNFEPLTYVGQFENNVLHPHKTMVMNEDGRFSITYKTSSGKLLATCTTGNDLDDCAPMNITNIIEQTAYLVIHLPKAQNNSLHIENYNNTLTNIAAVVPKIRLYTTKELLVYGVDYAYNPSTGYFTFYGVYANDDLFIELSYQLNSALITDQSQKVFVEKHNVGYTNWTVYYYDVKGRIKAITSPEDFACESLNSRIINRNYEEPLAFSCDKTEILASISLTNTIQEPNERMDVQVEIQPKFESFNALKTILNSNDFKLNTIDSLALKDSLAHIQVVSYTHPDSLQLFTDTVPSYYLNDSLRNLTEELLLDSALLLLDGKEVKISGQYMIGKRLANGSVNYFTNRKVPFDYLVRFKDTSVVFLNELSTGRLRFNVDSTELIEASEIVIKCDSLSVKIFNFWDAPVNSFNPCDSSVYIGQKDAQLLTTINAHMSMAVNASYFISSVPANPPPSVNLFSKKFYYNEYDMLIAKENIDEGRTDFVYDLIEDKLMFVQNDKQRANGGKFNYTNYDHLGRPIETGEYDPTISDPNNSTIYQFQTHYQIKNMVAPGAGFTSVSSLVTNANNLPNSARSTQQTWAAYDLPDPSAPVGFNQTYLNGKLSRLANSDHYTWYSYDERGLLKSTIQDLALPTKKTIEYDYDYFGKPTSIWYQKNQTDRFKQVFVYDADQRLISSAYNRNIGLANTWYTTSQLKYYLHGPVKRQILGNNMQGLDYVYNIKGLLKSVNNGLNPSIATNDPGNDGTFFTSAQARYADFFGYTLDYYPNDYERAGIDMAVSYKSGSFGSMNVSYTGQIRASRWNRSGINPTGNMGYGPYMYEYNYDQLYRLKGANFGVSGISGGSPNQVVFTQQNRFKLENVTYDKDGNIKTLKRYANYGAGNSLALMDDLTYVYSSIKKNRLTRVTDNIVTGSLGLSQEIDFPNHGAVNYQYNEVGQMISNNADNQVYEYNSKGLVKCIRNINNVKVLEFEYNNIGLRQKKISYNSVGAVINTIYYVYDASGGLICRYETATAATRDPVPPPYSILDYNLYGNGKIGTYDEQLGKPLFELTDHLGNVRTVFTDDNSAAASIVQTNEYYPHGGPLPGVNFNSSIAYRFGYQGMEKDAESRLTNFELRQLDPRLGRWFNPDPMQQHHNPYLSMSNNPINSIDPTGGYDYAVNYFDARTGESTNHLFYIGGVDISGMVNGGKGGPSFKQEMADAAANAETAKSQMEERFAALQAMEISVRTQDDYDRYMKAHFFRGSWGYWGRHKWVTGPKVWVKDPNGIKNDKIFVHTYYKVRNFIKDPRYEIDAALLNYILTREERNNKMIASKTTYQSPQYQYSAIQIIPPEIQYGVPAYYFIPVIGPALESGDQLTHGDYLGAAASFGIALVELFTLGEAAAYTTSMRIAARGVVNYSSVLISASYTYKGSTVLGHALSKHAGRKPKLWGKLTGNQSTWHNQALKHFDDIMNAPGGFIKTSNQQGVYFLEKRLTDGRGIRLNMDGTFKGFID